MPSLRSAGHEGSSSAPRVSGSRLYSIAVAAVAAPIVIAAEMLPAHAGREEGCQDLMIRTADPTFWQRREPLYPVVLAGIAALARLRYDLRVVGGSIPPAGPVLLAANHIASLDPVLLAMAVYRRGRKTRFLAVSGLWSVPVVGWLLRKGRMVKVHRGQGPERMTSDACRALAAGQAVLVYPEGTILPPGTQLPARRGAGMLALHARAPVIPIAIWGLGPHPAVVRRLRRRVGVAIGEPLDLSGHTDPDEPTQWEGASVDLLAAVRDLLPLAEMAARRR